MLWCTCVSSKNLCDLFVNELVPADRPGLEENSKEMKYIEN